MSGEMGLDGTVLVAGVRGARGGGGGGGEGKWYSLLRHVLQNHIDVHIEALQCPHELPVPFQDDLHTNFTPPGQGQGPIALAQGSKAGEGDGSGGGEGAGGGGKRRRGKRSPVALDQGWRPDPQQDRPLAAVGPTERTRWGQGRREAVQRRAGGCR